MESLQTKRILLYLVVGLALNFCDGTPISDFFQLRDQFLQNESSLAIGSPLDLEGDEIIANERLMAAKFKEVDEAFKLPSKFLPSKNFPNVHKQVENSKVFQIIRKMPKGNVLHSHLPCMASIDFLVSNVTHMPNLYVCFDFDGIKFHFFENPSNVCNWISLQELRDYNTLVDLIIRQHLTLPNSMNADFVWKELNKIQTLIYDLINYRPAFEAYLYQALQELYDDNVMYLEFRSVFSKLYELNGTEHDVVSTAEIYKSVIDQFKADHPDFLGAKVIYAAVKNSAYENFDEHINNYRAIKEACPDFLIGFDLVGQEDKHYSILNFAEKLIEFANETSFFFHAGETNWYGHAADENLIDAVLLNTERIGHGYALLKHPKVMELVKKKFIAIEINPISNQVLGLVKDLRNHPASYLFANDYPVVISNDDPNLWAASGLSYDFYEAFVGIMSRKADLRALKQLAINSIIYSKMNLEEQGKAFEIWEDAWNKFVADLAMEKY